MALLQLEAARGRRIQGVFGQRTGVQLLHVRRVPAHLLVHAEQQLLLAVGVGVPRLGRDLVRRRQLLGLLQVLAVAALGGILLLVERAADRRRLERLRRAGGARAGDVGASRRAHQIADALRRGGHRLEVLAVVLRPAQVRQQAQVLVGGLLPLLLGLQRLTERLLLRGERGVALVLAQEVGGLLLRRQGLLALV